jgi:hypothetical protein
MTVFANKDVVKELLKRRQLGRIVAPSGFKWETLLWWVEDKGGKRGMSEENMHRKPVRNYLTTS